MSERSFPKSSDRAASVEAGREAGPDASGAPPERAPATAASIEITVNGEPRAVAAGTTVTVLLHELGLGDRRVAVERNRAVVPRAEHARTVLAPGDHLELVTFVGGG